MPSGGIDYGMENGMYSWWHLKVGISGYGNLRTISTDEWATSKSIQLSTEVDASKELGTAKELLKILPRWLHPGPQGWNYSSAVTFQPLTSVTFS